MGNKRIVSIGADSRIYHKPGCRYVERIKKRNKLSLPKHDARDGGYRVCKYCNSMSHHVRVEQPALDYYLKNKGLQFNYIAGILFVRSEIGCWKLVYSQSRERINLYHRNETGKPFDFEQPQHESYHHQADKPYCNNIAGCLYYIFEHDRYKASVARGEKVSRFSNKKYERHAAKVKRRQEIQRVDDLFKMLERQNEGYKELSCH